MTEPIAGTNSHKVPLEHYCQHIGCKKWGGWGFDRGRRHTDWFCNEHKNEGSLTVTAPILLKGKNDGVFGPDGLIADEVGSWAKDKHGCLKRYIDISRGVRRRWVSDDGNGASYIDLFCGTGLSQIRRQSKDWIDGGAVEAWKMSVKGGAPFTDVFIADADPEKRRACAARLRRLNAPVREIEGNAVEAVAAIVPRLNPHGLHFAFIDPYSLEALDFRIIQSLAPLPRIDMLVHVSRMDLTRNALANVANKHFAFDAFAPGWRSSVNTNQSQPAIRRDVFAYWRGCVEKLGIWPSTEMRIITNNKGLPLYWLLMASKHDLANQFWKTIMDDSSQRKMF